MTTGSTMQVGRGRTFLLRVLLGALTFGGLHVCRWLGALTFLGLRVCHWLEVHAIQSSLLLYYCCYCCTLRYS